jgi:hypothetical protein
MLTQQMATMRDLVVRLAAAQPRDPDLGDPGCRSGGSIGHRQADPCPHHHNTQGGRRSEDEVPYNRHTLPKLSFPKFDGENPMIWIDKCLDYFKIFNILECLCTTAASMHMEENAAKWLQVYKLKNGLDDWGAFVEAIEANFGAYDYRKAMQDLLSLRQENSVEEYIKEFEGVQCQVSMFNPGFDELFFTSHFMSWFMT